MIFPKLILRLERWKFNKDYGVYVSTLGHFKDRHKRNLPYKINQAGYCAIQTERGNVFAHRLVLFTWKPIPNAEQLTVDHLNHNKRDNSLANLEWVTREENCRRAANDYIITDIDESKFYFCVNGVAFETIQQAYEYAIKIAPKGVKGNISLEQMTKYFIGQARERDINRTKLEPKNYNKMLLSAIKKGVQDIYDYQ